MKSWILLIGLSTVAVLVAGWFVPESRFLRKKHEHLTDFSNDPVQGQLVELLEIPTKDALGRRIASSTRDDLFVCGGSCTGCSLNAVSFSKLPTSEFERIFVFYQSDLETILKTFSILEVPSNVYLLVDEDEHLRGALNAEWTGRWYVMRSKRVVKIQSGPKETDWAGDRNDQ